MPDPAPDPLTLEFARHAALHGWTAGSLRSFREYRDISQDDALRRWPRGVRSLSWALNDYADAGMRAAFCGNADATAGAMIRFRLAQNTPLKASVRKLARSDWRHPIDTLRRTARTVRAMQACAPIRRGLIARWLLVLAYSACVIVWLSDGSPDQRATHRALRLCLALIGER